MFGAIDRFMPLVSAYPTWLQEFCDRRGFTAHVAIRLQDPAIDATPLRAAIDALRRPDAPQTPLVQTELIEAGHNIGFACAHNQAFRDQNPDFLLILADDIGLPFLTWLDEAIGRFDAEPLLALLAPPPLVQAGIQAGRDHPSATILLIRGSAFERAGLFDEGFAWATGEDADLAFRLQRLGFGHGTIDILHQHWSGTSLASMPVAVGNAIRTHNQARLGARWAHSIRTGAPGHFEIMDLWSDGIGDVLCALIHVAAACEADPALPRFLIVNTPFLDLARAIIPSGVRIESIESIEILVGRYRSTQIANLRSLRSVVFSQPLNVHVLVAAALGLAIAPDRIVQRIFDRLPTSPHIPTTPYAVVHLESIHAHDGRSPSASVRRALLQAVLRRYDTVVLLGQNPTADDLAAPDRPVEARRLPGDARRLIDLRGRLTIPEVLAVVARARSFAGIDSFPAHAAQLAGVPAAIVFGAVNPLTRTWSEHRVWPILAALDCLGCYHSLLEPAVPYCLRRDNACMTTIDPASIERALDALASTTPADWHNQRRMLEQHQARALMAQAIHA